MSEQQETAPSPQQQPETDAVSGDTNAPSQTPKFSNEPSEPEEETLLDKPAAVADEAVNHAELRHESSVSSHCNSAKNAENIRKELLQALKFVLVYFFFSTSLTLFIKLVAKSNLQLPLTVLSVQNFFNWFTSLAISAYIVRQHNLERDDAFDPAKKNVPRRHVWHPDIALKLLLVGVLTGFDYGLSNLSLQIIDISVYVFCKQTVPLWILCFSILLGAEKVKPLLIVSIFCTSLGIGGAVFGFTKIHAGGLLLVLSAAIIAAIRVIYIQVSLQHKQKTATDQDSKRDYQYLQAIQASVEVDDLQNAASNFAPSLTDLDSSKDEQTKTKEELQSIRTQELEEVDLDLQTARDVDDEEEQPDLEADATADHQLLGERRADGGKSKSNEISLVPSKRKPRVDDLTSIEVYSYVSPIVAMTVLPFALFLEGPGFIARLSVPFIAYVILVILVSGVLALGLNVSEFLLIRRTSGLTLTVVGTIKELVLIGSAALAFGEKLTVLNVVGYFVALIGVILFHYHKYTQVRQQSIASEVTPKAAEVALQTVASPGEPEPIELKQTSVPSGTTEETIFNDKEESGQKT